MTLHQFKMLKVFRMKSLTIPEALTLNQRTFGSLCRNDMVAYDVSSATFYVTAYGNGAYQEVSGWNYHRGNNNGKFSKYVPRKREFQLYRKAS